MAQPHTIQATYRLTGDTAGILIPRSTEPPTRPQHIEWLAQFPLLGQFLSGIYQ